MFTPCPVPYGVVTVIVIAPTVPAGVVNVILFWLVTVKLVTLVPPKVIAVAFDKYKPCNTTAVPPVCDPLFGNTPNTIGGFPGTDGGCGTGGCGKLPDTALEPVAKSPCAPLYGGIPSKNIALLFSVHI